MSQSSLPRPAPDLASQMKNHPANDWMTID
jgi:hypothetical protein